MKGIHFLFVWAFVSVPIFVFGQKIDKGNQLYYDSVYYDNVLKIMIVYANEGSFYNCIEKGMEAIGTPMSCQRMYPLMHGIYNTLSYSLLNARVPALLVEVSRKGNPIMKEQLLPDCEEYYSLSLFEAVGWLATGNVEKADSIYKELNKLEIKEISAALDSLHKEIEEEKTIGWSERKKKESELLERISKKLLDVNPFSVEGSALLKNYFSLTRNFLQFYYFDTSDPNDETLWNKWIAHSKIHFFIQCDELQGREAVLYDNILCYKDFLSYHDGHKIKAPVSWKDIQEVLSDNEVAIEVSCLPEEVLIIKKDILTPLSVRIDSTLFESLISNKIHEPLAIDRLYSPRSPLSKLWMLIDSKLDGIKTVYISGSNFFSELNYGAIALSEDSVVSEKYIIHQLLSTSDIIDLKQREINQYSTACMIGGIDYNRATITDSIIAYDDYEWNFSPFLPRNMRSGFSPLPNTYKEVEEISHYMDSINIFNVVKTGDQATEEFVKSLSGHNFDILHISTHGFMIAPLFNDTLPNRSDMGNQYQTILCQSGLLMANANNKWGKNYKPTSYNDGILSSKEICNLNFSNTKLAVLMACKSGMGNTTNHTGLPFGVIHAFKMAGVKQVLCCLWDVDDEVSYKMITHFYETLFKKSDARTALELSRKYLISIGFTSPFYWAPFVLIE